MNFRADQDHCGREFRPARRVGPDAKGAAVETSAKGLAYQESREGMVLKAYRCPAGKWTIGPGLTAASGVVTPKPGMTITRAEGVRLHKLALARNYEPRVRKAMPGAKQNEFDGGSSFDFNTGAIHRASWVKSWKDGDRTRVLSGLKAWVKGGGKVLPGLQRRRTEEADIILHDRWPADLKVAQAPNVAHAGIAISLTASELAAVKDGLRTLGFEPGARDGAIRLEAVTDFQKRYDLTVDGIIGRATLSTLQRELDGRRKAAGGAGIAVAGAGGAAGADAAAPDPAALPDPVASDLVWMTWAGLAMAGLAGLYVCWLAWQYRDLVAARLADRAPGMAAWLRSF